MSALDGILRDATKLSRRSDGKETRHTCGCVSAVAAGSAVGAWVIVVVEVVLRARVLVPRLVALGKRVCRGVRALVLAGRRLRLMVLLVHDTRGSRVMKMLGRRRTLLLVVGMMLHREKTHQ